MNWMVGEKYRVSQNDRFLLGFRTFADAAACARQSAHSKITFGSDPTIVWSSEWNLSEAACPNVPKIGQNPELPRGCEVTALAMLLQYAGAAADKMTLAREVAKDPTPFRLIGEAIHFGNPNRGFVGDMYTFDKPGLGVYHGPIRELAERYLPERILDLTGVDFADILMQIQRGVPVWVIINVLFDHVGDPYWQRWVTPDGEISVTSKEHSVLVTGYDRDWVYFHDPLGQAEKAKRESFRRGWEQMGRQAITYLPGSG